MTASWLTFQFGYSEEYQKYLISPCEDLKLAKEEVKNSEVETECTASETDDKLVFVNSNAKSVKSTSKVKFEDEFEPDLLMTEAMMAEAMKSTIPTTSGSIFMRNLRNKMINKHISKRSLRPWWKIGNEYQVIFNFSNT